MKSSRIVNGVASAIALICFIYLALSSFGVTNSYFGWDARHSGWGWKVLSSALLLATGYYGYLLATDKQTPSVGKSIIVMVGLVLAFMSSTGFKSTAGDIKQVLTCFRNEDGSTIKEGRVGWKVDPACIKEYYGEFYHLDTDTALWNYIQKYKELPGVNNWAYEIRFKIVPPSTAPRANEDFQWHTGSYDMDLNKKHR